MFFSTCWSASPFHIEAALRVLISSDVPYLPFGSFWQSGFTLGFVLSFYLDLCFLWWKCELLRGEIRPVAGAQPVEKQENPRPDLTLTSRTSERPIAPFNTVWYEEFEILTDTRPQVDKFGVLTHTITYISWLVVWNMSIFPYIGNNHPSWLIFFRGVETTVVFRISGWPLHVQNFWVLPVYLSCQKVAMCMMSRPLRSC